MSALYLILGGWLAVNLLAVLALAVWLRRAREATPMNTNRNP